MKRLLVILILLLCANVQAYTFFVKNGGDDMNTGLDSLHAWATLTKMGNTVNAGDTCYILGGTYAEDNGTSFTGSGDFGSTVHQNLRFAHGGTGDGADQRIFIIGHPNYTRPLIYGNPDPASSTRYFSLYLNTGNDYMTFRNLEFKYSWTGVHMKNCSYITFEDCKSTCSIVGSDGNIGSWTIGLFANKGSSHCRWLRCEAGAIKGGGGSWNSGTYPNGSINADGWHAYDLFNSCIDSCWISNDSGVNTAVFLKANCYKDTIKNCNFYSSGFSNWGIHLGVYARTTAGTYWWGEGAWDSCGQIYIHHNTFSNYMNGIAHQGDDCYSYVYAIDTVYVFNNTFYATTQCGYKWGAGAFCGTPLTPPKADLVWDHFYVFNNIYLSTASKDASLGMIFVGTTSMFSSATNVIDYNAFSPVTSTRVGSWGGGSSLNLANWRTASGQDAHSQNTNPNLTDPTNGDFRVSGSTPSFVLTGGTQVDGFGSTYIGAYGPADTTAVTGACCLPGYTCATGYTSAACTSAGGTWQGAGTSTCAGCTNPSPSTDNTKRLKRIHK